MIINLINMATIIITNYLFSNFKIKYSYIIIKNNLLIYKYGKINKLFKVVVVDAVVLAAVAVVVEEFVFINKYLSII